MLKSVDAKEYMTDQPVTVKPDTDIFKVIKLLSDHKISGATVVDDDNNVVGVISEFDCLKAILNGSYYNEAGGTVKDYMTTQVESIDNNLSIIEVAEQMLATKRRRFPVVEDGKFVGQLSVRGILNAVKSFDIPSEKPKH